MAETPRERIVEAAAGLLRDHGVAATTTRAVAAAAGVQSPAIYRLFGDKDGLLDAAVEHVLATYVAGKDLATESEDPVADLRRGWDAHIDFGLANPGMTSLLADPRRSARSPAFARGADVLRARVRRVAAAGRLRVSEEHAVTLLQAVATGTLLSLLGRPPEDRDRALADAAYAAVAGQVLTDAPAFATAGTVAAAVALRGGVDELNALRASEQALLADWLDRVIARG